MADDTVIIPQPPGSSPAEPDHRLPPRPRLLALLIAAGVIIVVLLGVIIALLMNRSGPAELPVATATPQADFGEAANAVMEFDTSFETADCDLFQGTTTTSFQDGFFGEPFACEPWEENAANLSVAGTYAYEVVVTDEKIAGDGGSAVVTTTETDTSGVSAVSYEVTYTLVNTDGSWLVDSVESQS